MNRPISAESLEKYLIDAISWACSKDTGASSRALLLSAITGKPPDPRDYPSDDSDRGRCVRMITALPWALPRSFVGWSEVWMKAWSKIEKRLENGELHP